MNHSIENKDFHDLMDRLGYRFKNPNLLAEAFRHSSFVNEIGEEDVRDNERLEFLGDAVLDLAISDILMELFDSAREGDLSKYRASVVNEKTLSLVAKELGLGDFLLLGKGEELTGGRRKPSILADTVEALLGAVYLDGGFEASKEIIRRFFTPHLEKIVSREGLNDFKSLLQEYTQAAFKTRPQYVLVKESGPAHRKVFRVALRLQGKTMAEAEGRSKKEAEQKAAKEAFLCLKNERELLS
ncbi:MAG: ribonuclease III [Deltaproteobacteria bacterium]|nr:ribonuclease III [Deltaproteobacteria bacterium]MBW2016185.1 ribonuclease III [Deltaproteobacteria bacterium]MBW2130334.1 ribonuclease III [Deltaproteobacteria bacterium]MBW2302698.1 ribonuclease III [Deltaproteobacteria bacterium]